MGLLDFLKRSSPAEPTDLRDELISCVARKDLPALAARVRQRREQIAAEFGDWMTVPQVLQQDQSLLAQYGEMLLAVARIVDHDGDPTLLKRLERDPADAPVEMWNEQMAIAASLSAQQRYGEAARLLEALAARLDTLRGGAVDFYRPRVLGKLGIALYQAGDTGRGQEMTRQARDICRQLGDEDGVQAYETNLANMGGS
jgi:hypothetical protein